MKDYKPSEIEPKVAGSMGGKEPLKPIMVAISLSSML